MEKIIEDENLRANKFNDFSINIGPELTKNIPPIEYIAQETIVTFTINTVTGVEVIKLLVALVTVQLDGMTCDRKLLKA